MKLKYDDIESTIKMRTIEVNGKKLNRTFINQLQQEKAFGEDYDFLGKERLGYVKGKGFWTLLFTNAEGYPRKHRIDEFLLNDSRFAFSTIITDERDKRMESNVKIYREEVKTMQVFI